jgi:hypothetical protein
MDGKMLQFIRNFMRERTLRVAVGISTLLDERPIENGVVQGAVLSVTLFIVIMAGVTDGTEDHNNRLRRQLDGTHQTSTPTSTHNPNTKSNE